MRPALLAAFMCLVISFKENSHCLSEVGVQKIRLLNVSNRRKHPVVTGLCSANFKHSVRVGNGEDCLCTIGKTKYQRPRHPTGRGSEKEDFPRFCCHWRFEVYHFQKWWDFETWWVKTASWKALQIRRETLDSPYVAKYFSGRAPFGGSQESAGSCRMRLGFQMFSFQASQGLSPEWDKCCMRLAAPIADMERESFSWVRGTQTQIQCFWRRHGNSNVGNGRPIIERAGIDLRELSLVFGAEQQCTGETKGFVRVEKCYIHPNNILTPEQKVARFPWSRHMKTRWQQQTNYSWSSLRRELPNVANVICLSPCLVFGCCLLIDQKNL